ncbi:Endopolyphosphatase-like protein [Emericellopsis cladophorae]|uniref:Endopolyphosphatase n=1 Tax=Emericellopsis cladophorae TaxID=2686198 RepID=A0A9P9Y5U0_9HYPO|nr:Endopolyphosphatase-like protein [Emericellopsis cladophorae]KAI6783798.1 Endopolyphosphatase-like protein [Emericellopsis cladophorae]
MSPTARWSHLLLLLATFSSQIAAASPLAEDSQSVLRRPQAEEQHRKLTGKFLHITDFHPDQYYKAHSSTEAGLACHRKKGLAGVYGAETTDCDSPFSLVNATFNWIQENIRDDVDFVVWTGDSARHDSDEKYPRSAAEVLSTNQMMADKFVDTFGSNHGRMQIPVVPTWGNNDFLPHNIFYPGPNRWLRKYSDIWRRFIPEEQRHSFEFGGWFWSEVVPQKLAVFSLNTMYFFDRNAGVDGCASPTEPGYQHMEWLRVQLELFRQRGMKAILIGHVPPARTSSKKLWDETCWQKYTLWLHKYRDVVTGSLYGHMNIDHFLLQDTREADLAINAQALSEENDDANMAEEDDDVDAQDDEVSVASKEDYLQDLRKGWLKIPGDALKSATKADVDSESQDIDASRKKGKKKKHKKKKKKKKDKLHKIGGKYAERYILSFVSPSIVPNYFPTMRIIEYNVTGLQDAAVWTDTFDETAYKPMSVGGDWSDDELSSQDARQLRNDLQAERKKKKKKHKKPNKPKDPNLHLPEDPPKGSTPGPAYYPQPLTFTGYTQYFANLTHINNDIAAPDADSNKWRDGDHQDDEPQFRKPKPRPFKFEVEYSTFDDKIYKLDDLTVINYLKLAHRIGKREKKKKNKKKHKGKGKALWDGTEEEDNVEYDMDYFDAETDEDEDDEDTDFEDDTDVEEDDALQLLRKGKKHKKSKHKKNKAWLHFLDHAFVRTVPEEQLERLS